MEIKLYRLKMIKVVGSCQTLKIQEQPQNFVNWWPETKE
jgi:hypothetical protein